MCFTGDAVLGEGSVFIAPDPGALRGYLAALRRLRAMDLALLCPGHGPVVEDPAAKLDEYLAHRLDRERRVIAALDAGARTVDELLDAAWADAPAVLRPAAAVTLAAHLDKLEEEGRLPEGVERPSGRGARGPGRLRARRVRRPGPSSAPSASAALSGVVRRGVGEVEDLAQRVADARDALARRGRGRSRRARARRRC